MTFDALAMHAIRDEIERDLVGGHVDDAMLVDARRVALEVYTGKRRSLVCCLDPADSRLYVTTEQVRPVSPPVTPLSLLLRKYVRGSRILRVEQPRLERLLVLHLSSRPDQGLPRQLALVIEAMGRRSNLVLVDEDGAIMDALVRLPPSVNPARPILPHLRYTGPPRETKRDPLDPDLPAVLESRARERTEPAWQILIGAVTGLSPLAAREAIARATVTEANVLTPTLSQTERGRVFSWGSVCGALAELVAPVESRAWQPSIAWRDGVALAFAPYVLRQFGDAEVRGYDTMSEVVAMASPRVGGAAPLQRLRAPLMKALSSHIESVGRRRSSLERSLASADRAEMLRESGEAILASVHDIPEGAASLEWEGRRIDLYPTLSPVENAQAYFRQYANARDAKRSVPPRLAEAGAELDYLEEMIIHVQLAETEADLAQLKREMEAARITVARGPSAGKRPSAGKTPSPRRAKAPRGSFRRLQVNGTEILVGASALGNEVVTFRLSGPEDFWFHARGVPGAHVVLRAQGSAPTEKAITAAARVAAAHSAARTEAHVEVDYTLRKFVRKETGGPAGRVRYRFESTIRVEPTQLPSPLEGEG